MSHAKPSLFARDDTFLGVCEGLAEDFGFNPLWLRMVFTVGVFVSPVAALSAYLALGIVVMAVHWFVPSSPAVLALEATDASLIAGNDEAAALTALAA